MFDFPSNPSIGQQVVTPAGATLSWDGTKWTAVAGSGSGAAGAPSDTLPLMDGNAVAGSSLLYSRGDHQHPTDTSRAAAAALPLPANTVPSMDGTGSAGTVATYSRSDHQHPTDTSRAAATAVPAASTNVPPMDGAGAIGTGTAFARNDHQHPTDTTRAAASAVPSPSIITPLMDAAVPLTGTGTAYSREDHVHPSDSSRLALSGGTLTGPLVLAADPGTNLTAATKQYVDSKAGLAVPGITVSDTPPTGVPSGALWFDSIGVQTYVSYNDGSSQAWVAVNNQQGALLDAPADGALYARQRNNWAVVGGDPSAANNVGRSFIHNPGFTVQQRGTGPWTAASNYGPDRWMCSVNGTGATGSYSIVTLADADRTAIGDESAQFACQNVFTPGTDTVNCLVMLQQRIENPRRLSGKTVTLSFWARGTTAGLNLGLLVSTNISSSVAANPPGLQPISTTWARYTFTTTVPSAQGKTVSAFDNVVVFFTYAAGSVNTPVFGNMGMQSGTILIYGVQLEIGSQATPLARRDPADELAICQRFYQVGTAKIWGYNSAANPIGYFVPYPVQMRASANVALNGQTYGNASGLTVEGSFISGFTAYAVVTATGNAWWATNYTASADL